MSSYGFVVISERRSEHSDPMGYAGKGSEQIGELLKAGIAIYLCIADYVSLASAQTTKDMLQ